MSTLRLSLIGGALVAFALAMTWWFYDPDCAKVTGFLGDHERVARGHPGQVMAIDDKCASGIRWVWPPNFRFAPL
jgi:hypothetical protein